MSTEKSQPQRSEQQKWTRGWLREVRERYPHFPDEFYVAIADAHNSVLAAERDRADKNAEDKKVMMHVYVVSQDNDRLKQELAAERQLREQAEADLKACQDYFGLTGKELAEHDTEVCKPLVEALLKARETIYALHGNTAWEIYEKHSPDMKMIDAALAQYK